MVDWVVMRSLLVSVQVSTNALTLMAAGGVPQLFCTFEPGSQCEQPAVPKSHCEGVGGADECLRFCVAWKLCSHGA
jgi:hypothetical protein